MTIDSSPAKDDGSSSTCRPQWQPVHEPLVAAEPSRPREREDETVVLVAETSRRSAS